MFYILRNRNRRQFLCEVRVSLIKKYDTERDSVMIVSISFFQKIPTGPRIDQQNRFLYFANV